MKLFIKLRNKYFTAFVSLALLVLASIGLFNLNSVPQGVDASMVNFDNEKTITISNGSFSSFSSSASYPYKLSNYTNSGNSTPSMKTGVINISDKEYAKNYEKYGLTEYGNPKGTGSDNYVLMINTEEDSDYTYTSNEFTLEANGCYYVTVSAKTIGDNSVASVFLMEGNTIFEDCIIQNISSTGWNNYTFFIVTNPYESVTLKFGMQIGSQSTRASGCVLFDELHAGQISNETLSNCISTFNPSTFVFKGLRSSNAYKSYHFDNTIVEYVDSEGKVITGSAPNLVDDNYFATSSSGGGEKTVDVNNNIMTISTKDTYVIYKGQEEVLQPNSVYRFAINVKASAISSGSAFVKLDEIIDENDDKYEDFMESTTTDISAKSSNLTISSVTSNTVTNGYVEYVVYVNTGALDTSKVQFSFGLGTESANATGTVSFKDYFIERVPYSAYSSASTGSTVGKIDIADRISLNSSEYPNYTFDKMQTTSFDGVPYPATPTDWTKNTTGSGCQLSGVVNLSAFDKVMNKYSSQINTIATPAILNSNLNNNVLMIYNGTNSVQSYTSTSKTLSANKYYKITTFVNTHMWEASANGVTVLAKTGSTVLAQASNIKTAGAWQKVELYIHTPSNSVDVTLEFALGYGNNLSSGYSFFDNILVEESDTEGDFSNRFGEYVVATNGKVEVDLTNPMISSTTSRDFNTPVLYTGENKGETIVNAGIVDLTTELKAVIASDKVEALRSLSGDNRKVLAISTALNVDSYYQYTSVLKYNFTSGKYYKLSFALFTDGISQEDKEEKYDEGKLAEGVSVELTGLENAKFSYITSNGKWTNYEFYIGVNSTATSNLVFTLGSDFTGCYGRAFLGNIVLEEVEESAFTATSSNDNILKVDTIEETEDEEDTEEKSKSSRNNFSWEYTTTILTFLAIVVAVVAVFIRRNIKFKKRAGNKKAVYDRDITVMQNKYRRIASDTRDKEVRELTKECNELIALRTEYEEKYKDALNRLRSVRLANRDGSKQHEITAIEREVKHISKEVARYGVQVNNYESEIEFMQTEAYLVELSKRMMREENIARNQVRKEAELPEEQRLQAIAKREAKQARIQEKAELKAKKLADKQAKLVKEREAIQAQLIEAKAKDEQFVKEQELLKIRVEEAKLAKEKAKAEKELARLEKEKAEQELEKKQLEQELAKVKQEENQEVTDAEIVDSNESAISETSVTDEGDSTVENVDEQANVKVDENVSKTEATEVGDEKVGQSNEVAEQSSVKDESNVAQSNDTEVSGTKPATEDVVEVETQSTADEPINSSVSNETNNLTNEDNN